MIAIPKGKIPKQLKIEITLDIDRDVYMEKLREGWNMDSEIQKAVRATRLITHRMISDYDQVVIKDIIFEEH